MERILPVLRERVDGEKARHYTCLGWNVYRSFAYLELLWMLVGPLWKCHDGWIERRRVSS